MHLLSIGDFFEYDFMFIGILCMFSLLFSIIYDTENKRKQRHYRAKRKGKKFYGR